MKYHVDCSSLMRRMTKLSVASLFSFRFAAFEIQLKPEMARKHYRLIQSNNQIRACPLSSLRNEKGCSVRPEATMLRASPSVSPAPSEEKKISNRKNSGAKLRAKGVPIITTSSYIIEFKIQCATTQRKFDPIKKKGGTKHPRLSVGLTFRFEIDKTR